MIRLGRFAGLLLVAAFLSPGFASAQAPKQFFLPMAKAASQERQPAEIQSPAQPVDFNAGEMLGLQPGEEIELSLPNGHSYPVVFEATDFHGAGVTSWIGYLKERGTNNRVILTTGPGGSFASIDTPQGNFRVVPGESHDWLVDWEKERQFHAPINMGDDARPAGVVEPLPDLRNAHFSRPLLGSGAGLAKSTPSNADIDMMIVVSPGLANHLGSTLGTRLNFLVTRANTAYADSEIGMTLHLVYYTVIANTTFDNSDDSTALDSITPSSGTFNAAAFGNIETLRAQYGADMVSFLRDGSGFGGSGIAWVPNSPTAGLMYSTVNGCVFGCEHVWIHEVGHNMGNEHDRPTYSWQGNVPNPPSNPPNYGYPFCKSGALTCNPFTPGGCSSQPECSTTDLSNFSDIMSYFQGTTEKVYKFSNSTVTCAASGGDGVPRPCGFAAGNPNSADTASTMNGNRVAISALKASVSVMQFSQPSYSAAESAGTITFVVHRTGASTPASVNYSLSNINAISGIDFAPASGTLIWGSGDMADKSFNVTLTKDQAVEGIEMFTAALSSPGAGQLGNQSTAIGLITENWPAGGTMPAGWISPPAPASSVAWAVDNTTSADGDGLSLKSGTLDFSIPARTCPDVGFGTVPCPSALQYTGTFLGGSISFAYRVSAFPSIGFIEFFVDGIMALQATGNGADTNAADTGWLSATVPITAGSHTIRWQYRTAYPALCKNLFSGPTNFPNCLDRAWIDAVALPTTGGLVVSHTNISSSVNPSTVGQSVTFMADIDAATTITPIDGTVAFRDGGAILAGCEAVPIVNGAFPVVNHTAACSTAALSAGAHSITAAYSGNVVGYATTASISAPLTQTVNASVSLTVVKAGAGTGTVASLPAGIACGATCTNNFTGGASVTLTPTASAGSYFSGWSAGPCSGLTACVVTLSGATSVTANFAVLAGSATPSLGGVTTLDLSGQSMMTTSLGHAVTLQNSGNGTLTISTVTAGAPFAQTNNCTTLAPGAFCTITLTVTPGVQGAVGGTLTVTTSNGAPTVTLAATGELSLTTHYYQSILRREPDAGGKTFWNGEATRVSGLGANVNEAWYALAMTFYTSAEYAAFARDNTGYTTDLFNTFFNRAPDPAGLSFWSGQLDLGLPREVLLASFMFSPEFVSFAQGIFGNTAARAEVNTVVDFYRGLLSRLPDSGGFNFWVQQFHTAQCQGGPAVFAQVEAISSGFTNSAEYAARGRSASQYVGDLYNSFLRRGGDLAGVQFWIDQINTGAKTREQVRQAFVGSPEFNARVVAIVNQPGTTCP